MDLAHLRDLLGLLRDMGVAAFSAGGIAVTFKDGGNDDSEIGGIHVPLKGRTKEKVVDDEDGSTSSKPVAGFKDLWHNPNLWPNQAGKVIKFDGTLE